MNQPVTTRWRRDWLLLFAVALGLRITAGLVLDGFRHPLPWALSGGLDAANVGDAVARYRRLGFRTSVFQDAADPIYGFAERDGVYQRASAPSHSGDSAPSCPSRSCSSPRRDRATRTHSSAPCAARLRRC